MGNSCVIVSITVSYGRFRSKPRGVHGGPNVKIISSILSVEGTKKLVCIPPILVGVTLEVGVMSFMGKY